MSDVYVPPVSVTDPEQFRQLLRASMLDWDIGLLRSQPLKAQIALRQMGDVRAMRVESHHPLSALRGTAEIARDYTSYIGLVYPQADRFICRQHCQDVTVEPGEIMLVHTARPLEIIVPAGRRLSMLIPADHFHERFPELDPGSCLLHLRPSNIVALLSGCLDALAEKIFPRAEESATPAIRFIIDMLEAALLNLREPADRQAALFERITRFISDALKDSALTPAAIARANGISVRYLHLLFSRRGLTVGGWIKNRRLEACRRRLSDPRKEHSVTELALEWGFSDAAHFCKSFKSRFGVSPSRFRQSSTSRGRLRLP